MAVLTIGCCENLGISPGSGSACVLVAKTAAAEMAAASVSEQWRYFVMSRFLL
jgi:hypothetical protein